jgi:hypothetical protein
VGTFPRGENGKFMNLITYIHLLPRSTKVELYDHDTKLMKHGVLLFPGVKLQGREADHSPPTSAEVKKMWIYTFTPLYVFMA